jgi:hypothetical protein
MSHFAVYTCNVSNIDFVKRGLEEMGLSHKTNQQVKDWAGQNVNVELAVVKDGRVLPIGWNQKTDAEGNQTLELTAEWFQVPLREKEFTNQISQLHSKYQVLQTCEENRWNVDENDIQFNQNGEIEIMAYSFA